MPYRPYTTKVDSVDFILADHVNNLQTDVSDLTFNVKGFGALGNDSANDTTPIQDAIDAANAAGGGTVWFPRGTYQTNKLTLYTAVNLVGVGPHASIIKLRASQNSALLTTNGFVTTDSSAGIHSFRIEGLAFDGNKAGQGSNADSGCVQIYGYNYDLRNVHIRNGKTVNLYTNWGTGVGSPGPAGQSMESRLYGVESYLAATDGIVWNGPHDSMWDSVIVHENGGKGIDLEARGNALKATSCHSWGNSQTYAWYINGSAQCLNCEAEGAATMQVHVRVNDVSWMGGQVYAAGGIASGIEIANSASGYNINTKVLNCTTAAILFTSDGGGKADLTVYGTSGATFSGTVSSNTYLRIYATGGQVPLLTSRFPLPAIWTQDNVAASQTNVSLNIYGDTTRQVIPMLRAGYITGVIVRSNENRVAGTLTITVYKNGSPTSLTAVLNGSAVTFKGSYASPGAISFSIGDEIGVRITTDGSWSPTTADITAVVEVTDG